MQKQAQVQGRINEVRAQGQQQKPKLRVVKVAVQKKGMNAGISGGHEQCC